MSTVVIPAVCILLLFAASVLGSDPGDGKKSVPTEQINRHIINGWDVQPGEVPFLCVLGYSRYYCSCTIVALDWILTVAHCVHPGESGTVIAGTEYFGGPNVTRSTHLTVFHPRYDPNDESSTDLALLRLNEPFPVDHKIHPIPLASDTSIPHRYDWQIVGVAGWGITHSGQTYISRASKGTMLVLPERICSQGMGGDTSNFICTIAYPSTICYGDNGGPVFTFGRDYGIKLIGIAAYSSMTCDLQTPAISIYLGADRDWIRSVTGI